jgi:hypothetical protein
MKDMGSGITAFRKGLKEAETGESPSPTPPAQIPSPAPVHAAEKKSDEVVKRS